MSAENEAPDSPKPPGELPELKIKSGFKNPVKQNSRSSQSSQSSGSALSIDEMLAITGKSSSSDTSVGASDSVPTEAPTPPPAPMPVSAPPAPVRPQEMPPPPTPFPTNAEPMTLSAPSMLPPEPMGMGSTPNPNPFSLAEKKRGLSDLFDKFELSPKLLKGVAGAMALVLGLLLVASLGGFFNDPVKLLIKSKPSSAEVYLGDKLLGKTPLRTELSNLDEMPVLKLDGYETREVPKPKELKDGKVNKVFAKLQGVQFPLDWSGLPKDTRIWWEGAEGKPKSATAGEYKVKVKPKGQSSFIWTAAVLWNDGQAFNIGKSIDQELKKRPVIKLSISGAAKASVIVKDGPRFTQTVSLTKAGTGVILPGPGSYAVKVKGTNKYGAFSKDVKLKAGDRKSVKVALVAPQRRVAAPSQGRPRYNPRPYRAPRRYHGGGGATIAPPSF